MDHRGTSYRHSTTTKYQEQAQKEAQIKQSKERNQEDQKEHQKTDQSPLQQLMQRILQRLHIHQSKLPFSNASLPHQRTHKPSSVDLYLGTNWQGTQIQSLCKDAGQSCIPLPVSLSERVPVSPFSAACHVSVSPCNLTVSRAVHFRTLKTAFDAQ